MIQSVSGSFAEQIMAGKLRKGFPTEIAQRAKDMFELMNAAAELKDLSSPPGNRLKPLSGQRKGQHSIRINDQWRICFNWTTQGPHNVEIVDYH